MNVSLPQCAFFLPPPSSENSGVDFLGLRQANLDMMTTLIPGTNNVTSYIRPFSLLSWVFWKFHGLCEREGKDQPTSEDIRLFRERIEVLFTWGARLEDTSGIPGKRAAPPPARNGHVVLTFKAWGRVQSSTSLIAALWYGPASKTATGLGFLEPYKAGFFRATTSKGVLLARALDGLLRENSSLYARLLDTLADVTATEDDVRALWALWGPVSLTDAERHTFAQALFDNDAVGNYTTVLGQRSSTIALTQFHLSRSAKPQTVEQVRCGIYFAMLPDGTPYDVPEALQTARHRWIVLQVRQLQRLALESLLSWCEARIGKLHDTAALTAEAARLFSNGSFGCDPADTLAAMITKLDAEATTLDLFAARGSSEPLFSPFELMDRIDEHFKAGDERFAATSLYSLLLCVSFAGYFADHERAVIAIGGASRLSLFHLRKRLVALGGVSLKQAIQFILESMVLSQHFATAVNRFDGQNQRLRVSIEEEGLIPLAAEPWQPTVTEDRLPTLLALMAECGLIKRVGETRDSEVSYWLHRG